MSKKFYYIRLLMYGRTSKPITYAAKTVHDLVASSKLPTRIDAHAFGPKGMSPYKWNINSYGIKIHQIQKKSADGLLDLLNGIFEDSDSISIDSAKPKSKDKFRDQAWTASLDKIEKLDNVKGSADAVNADFLGRTLYGTVFRFSVNCSLFYNINNYSIFKFIKCIFNYYTIDYSFCTIEESMSDSSGFLYSEHNVNYPECDPRLKLEESAWWQPDTNRQLQARGVYWGNFFGSTGIAPIVRQNQQLLEDLRNLSSIDSEKTPVGPVLFDDFDNGALSLRLTNDPLHGHPESPQYGLFVERREAMRALMLRENLLVIPKAEQPWGVYYSRPSSYDISDDGDKVESLPSAIQTHLFDTAKARAASKVKDSGSPSCSTSGMLNANLAAVLRFIADNGPLVPSPLFFEGNHDEASIGGNLDKHPGMDTFRKKTEAISANPEVMKGSILVVISEIDGSAWPFADTLLICTSASRATVKRWFKSLSPTDVFEVEPLPADFPYPRPISLPGPLADGFRWWKIWWD